MSEGHETKLQKRRTIISDLQRPGGPKPCDGCDVCRLQLHEARAEARYWAKEVKDLADHRLQLQLEVARLQGQLDALRALEVANWQKAEPATRWPAEATTITDQAKIATRLVKLSELTGLAMVEHLEQCRDVGSAYRLQPFNTLAAVERMAGYTWDDDNGSFYRAQPEVVSPNLCSCGKLCEGCDQATVCRETGALGQRKGAGL